MPPEMYHGLGLHMSQRQEMVMTPQMIQSMELLQMPLMELEQRIQTELLENPALELAELKDGFDSPEAEELGGGEDDSGHGSSGTPDAKTAQDDYGGDDAYGESGTEAADFEWGDIYDEVSPRRGVEDDEDRFDFIANAHSRGESYPDHLIGQLSLINIDARTRELAEKIICQLDEAGYLNASLADLAQAEAARRQEDEELQAQPLTLEDWEDALFIVQSLHPPGTGARDLRECLLLQLYTNEDPAAGLARAIVENRLEDLAANRLPQIAKAERTGIEQVKDAVRLIQSLEPRPGVSFSGGGGLPVRPDVVFELVEYDAEHVEKIEREILRRERELREASLQAYDEKGEYRERLARGRLHEAELERLLLDQDGLRWEVRLPSGPVPEISDIFLALYDSSGRGELARKALMADPERAAEFKSLQKSLRGSAQNRVFRERFMAANDIVRAVRQRDITIYRVGREIVARQKDYLAGRGPAPAPLMMKEVAETLDIDIGTVSRAAREKFAETPLGLRPLREFFTRAVATTQAVPSAGGGGGGLSGATAANGAAFAAAGGGDDEQDGEESLSNIQIRNRIKEMIDAEDKSKPLKDDRIQVMLEKEGIVIKRRTVAKHRLKLGYKNYSQRREY